MDRFLSKSMLCSTGLVSLAMNCLRLCKQTTFLFSSKYRFSMLRLGSCSGHEIEFV